MSFTPFYGGPVFDSFEAYRASDFFKQQAGAADYAGANQATAEELAAANASRDVVATYLQETAGARAAEIAAMGQTVDPNYGQRINQYAGEYVAALKESGVIDPGEIDTALSEGRAVDVLTAYDQLTANQTAKETIMRNAVISGEGPISDEEAEARLLAAGGAPVSTAPGTTVSYPTVPQAFPGGGSPAPPTSALIFNDETTIFDPQGGGGGYGGTGALPGGGGGYPSGGGGGIPGGGTGPINGGGGPVTDASGDTPTDVEASGNGIALPILAGVAVLAYVMLRKRR